jgi:hypothetical protein
MVMAFCTDVWSFRSGSPQAAISVAKRISLSFCCRPSCSSLSLVPSSRALVPSRRALFAPEPRRPPALRRRPPPHKPGIDADCG